MAVFNKDKTWQSGAYFNEKNGVRPIVKPGRNFDNDELFYMSKPRVSIYIANKIESITFNKPYFMIEICAGIGGNTTEFASRKNCATIMAFERDKQRSIYLQRNLKAYKLDDKSVVVNSEVTGEEEFDTYKGSIFYFDPPWLPTDYRSTDGNYKTQYIRKDMKVGKLSLEEWLEKLKPIAYMVGIRVPDNYELGEVDGWTYETENLGKTPEMKALAEDGKLFFCFNNSFVKGASDTKFGGYIKNLTSFKMKLDYTDTSLAERFIEYRQYCSKLARSKSSVDEDCPFVKYRFIDTEPEELLPAKVAIEEKVSPKAVVSTEEVDDIPLEKQVPILTGIPKPTKGLEPGSAEWIAEFQNYLSVILGKFITKEGKPYTELINNLLTGEYMMTWIKAFTTQSAEPDQEKNYETLEIIGDAVYEYSLMMELPGIMKKFGISVNSITINNVKQKYKSGKAGKTKGFQTYLGDAFRFSDWIIKGKLETLEETINEDLIESFYGALHTIGNQVGNSGTMGVKLVWKMTKFWTQYIQISKKAQESDVKTNVTQRFQRLGIPDKEAVFFSPLGGGRDWKGVIKLTDKAYDRLVLEGIPINKKEIGYSEGISLGEAELLAWRDADRYLDLVGFTVAKSEDIKENTDWKRLKKNYTSIYNEFKQIAKRNGITDPEVVFKFDITNVKDKNEYYIVLTQTTDKGVRKVGEGRAKDRLEAIANSLDDYINK
jgi:dsRNA-specific ribonuclease/16S rRNA G966 N2-methylase RsmD